MPENPLAIGVFCEHCLTRVDDTAYTGSVVEHACPLCGGAVEK